MATSTISGFTAVTAGNLTGAAVMLVDDSNGATRKSSLATLRTKMFAGGTGYTAADPLTAGAASLQAVTATSADVSGASSYLGWFDRVNGTQHWVWYATGGSARLNNGGDQITVDYATGAVTIASGLTIAANGITITAGNLTLPLGAGTGIVSVGAADSGGAGFKLLRVPN